ncbi:MAG TPA: hypothetical protein VGL09_20140 [Methylomirabilota bacterium]|jgi:hypothetical protein
MTGLVLLGIILTSGLGAVVVCALVLVYGYTPEINEKPREAVRRLALTRAAHAAATVCFAVSALLGIVALGMHARTVTDSAAVTRPTAELGATVSELQERQARLREDISRMAARLNELEARTRLAETRVQALEGAGATPAAAPREPVPLPPRAGRQ